MNGRTKIIKKTKIHQNEDRSVDSEDLPPQSDLQRGQSIESVTSSSSINSNDSFQSVVSNRENSRGFVQGIREKTYAARFAIAPMPVTSVAASQKKDQGPKIG